MTKITFKTIADKYDILEEDVEMIFACYDTNDLQGMEEAIGYCFFCSPNTHIYDLMFDIIRYIKQCELKEKQEYSIRDVRFDTSRYTENKPHIIKKIPIER